MAQNQLVNRFLFAGVMQVQQLFVKIS